MTFNIKNYRFDIKQLFPVFIYLALLAAMYFSALKWLVIKDWSREVYSYCYLVPLIILYLLWFNKERFAAVKAKPTWIGFVPIVLGILLFWLGELSGEFFSMYMSLWLIIVGLCWLHFGWDKLKTIWFPLFFMLTMFPLPHFVITRLTLKLQLMASNLGTNMIQALGMPVYLEGNVITLAYTQLQVVEACSGLNSLISLVVLSLLMVYFFRDHIWKRVVLFFSCIPLAIALNGSRITLTAVLYKYFGQAAADGFFHGFSGLMIFLVAIPVLLLEMWILAKLPPRVKPAIEKPELALPDADQIEEGAVQPQKVLLAPRFVLAVLIMGLTMVLSTGIEFREKTPSLKPFSEFPLAVADWKSPGTQKMEQIFVDELDLSDYVVANFIDPQRKAVNLYVAYYTTQSKGKSIHSPATCLPGGGWEFNQSGTVPLTGFENLGKPVKVNRAVMQMGDAQQVAYYWFPQRGRILTNAYQLKIFNFWDALTLQRTDGALVRVITDVYAGEAVSDAEKRLQAFVHDIVPVLDGFIPGRALNSSEKP